MSAGVWIVMAGVIMRPWARFVLGAIVAAAIIGGLWGLYAYGVATGRNEIQQQWSAANAEAKAQAARDEAMATRIVSDTAAALSSELANLKIQHTTIHRTIENEVREVPVYSECLITGRVFDGLNQLLAETAAGDAAGAAAAVPGGGATGKPENGYAGK